MNFPQICVLILFPILVILLELGRRFRVHRRVEAKSSAIESAVFALFGLLLAFSFSGAMTRYDAHRNLVTQETNDIRTAYLRLDLLSADSQPALRQLFREYTSSRLNLYEADAPEISDKTAQLQQQIWEQAVRVTSAPGARSDAAKLLLPALNDMIAITLTRQNVFNMHPPVIVYVLLFVLSCWCAFLAGYSMPATNWLYIFTFAFVVTLTIYATLEVEYPRQGWLVHLAHTDRSLISLRNSMK